MFWLDFACFSGNSGQESGLSSKGALGARYSSTSIPRRGVTYIPCFVFGPFALPFRACMNRGRVHGRVAECRAECEPWRHRVMYWWRSLITWPHGRVGGFSPGHRRVLDLTLLLQVAARRLVKQKHSDVAGSGGASLCCAVLS